MTAAASLGMSQSEQRGPHLKGRGGARGERGREWKCGSFSTQKKSSMEGLGSQQTTEGHWMCWARESGKDGRGDEGKWPGDRGGAWVEASITLLVSRADSVDLARIRCFIHLQARPYQSCKN